jgi:tRNA (mo5U34)-methyltransferase
MAKRGARVVAMDHDPHYLAQADWVARQFGLSERITLRLGDIYELAGKHEKFDVVLFLGVFYHLRHPLLGLDLAAAASRDLLLFQSLCMPGPQQSDEPLPDPGYRGREALIHDGWPKMAFIEGELAGDPTNWWLPNSPAMDAMVRSGGYAVVASPEPDTRVCRRTQGAKQVETELHDLLAQLQHGG